MTDTVNRFGVTLGVTSDGGVTGEVLLNAQWSITGQGLETDEEMKQLEGALDLVEAHIDPPEIAC